MKNKALKKVEKTPSTNRGVDSPLLGSKNTNSSLMYQGFCNSLKQFVLFDWFQATILSDNFELDYKTGELLGVKDFRSRAIELFQELFGINSYDLAFEYKGINGYNASFCYKEIYIMYHTNRPEMGIHIKMSGRGCRDFENLGLDYFTFFRKLKSYTVNFNRIDISVDDFTNRYFTLSKLIKYTRNGLVVSKFMNCINIEKINLEDSVNIGHTLQFGSKASNLQITFYDKKKERISAGNEFIQDIKYWTRSELRFRHEYAKQVVNLILENENNVNQIVKSILNTYIHFKEKDSKISRTRVKKDAQWWTDYVENIETLKLTNYLPEDSISRKSDWILSQVSKSNLMVYLSELNDMLTDEITNEYLIKLLTQGVDKLRNKDLQVINEHRISKKLIPFTESEIRAFIQDLNDKFVKENCGSSELPIIDIMLTSKNAIIKYTIFIILFSICYIIKLGGIFMNKNKQKIKCNVESCTFQNNSINCCTLSEIEIDCTCDNDKAKTKKETICKSFKTNIN